MQGEIQPTWDEIDAKWDWATEVIVHSLIFCIFSVLGSVNVP